jgi:hypothetical protein
VIESILRRLAALAILVAGGVHLDLWLRHGYRAVHVIGPLFLINGIAAALIATLLAWRAAALIELAGLGYAVSTLAAFFVSVYHGLFGFVEALNGTPQTIAALAEATALVLLTIALARSHVSTDNPRRLAARPNHDDRHRPATG